MDYKILLASTAIYIAPVFDNTVTSVVDTFPEILEKDDILKRSKDSQNMISYWDKTDDIVEGYEAIKASGKKWLPKFEDEPDKDYKNRLEATKFTNIYRDIVEGLSSKPFEEEITLSETDENSKPPQEIEELIEDIDGAGNNITVFASHVFFNGINSAIDWIFVDFPKKDPSIKTISQAKAAGIRPFWSHVLARNVLDARAKVIGGKETLHYIRILEPGNPDCVRIFNRDDTTGTVSYYLYERITDRRNSDYDKFKKIEEGIITIGVIPLIPFITGRRDGRSFKIFPPMRDAADLQIELYQQESGLKFAKMMTAYAMLSGNGIKPQVDANGNPKKIAVGPSKVLYAPNDANGNTASWSYVEPSATSLKFLADDIAETKKDLRELGRQPLTAQSGNLTVITTAVAAGKAKSAVGAWALMLKDTLENALVITNKWLGINETQYSPQVNVYDEFDEFLDGQTDIDALNSARSGGDLSQETYWSELKRRRVLSSEFDPDEERKKLLNEEPGGDGLTGEGNNPPEIDPELEPEQQIQ